MDANEIEDCLGKRGDSPEVTRLLKALGVKQKLKASPEGYLRIELKRSGLLLSFKPEDAKSSGLKFTGVQFYSDCEEGWTTFAGALPRGLSFTDTPDAARKRLGKPTKSMKDFRLDHWIAAGRQLSVQYRKGLTGIAHVLSGFPRSDSK